MAHIIRVFSQQIEEGFGEYKIIPILHIIGIHHRSTLTSRSAIRFGKGIVKLKQRLRTEVFSPYGGVFFVCEQFIKPSVIHHFFGQCECLLIIIHIKIHARKQCFDTPYIEITILLVSREGRKIQRPRHIVYHLLIALGYGVAGRLMSRQCRFNLDRYSQRSTVVQCIGHSKQAGKIEQSQSAQGKRLGFDTVEGSDIIRRHYTGFDSFQQTICLVNHAVRLIPYRRDVQGIICRNVKFIVRRYTLSGSFADTCLNIFATTIGIIEVIIAIVTVRSSNTIDTVQGYLCLFECTDSLRSSHRSRRIQVQPVAGTGRTKKRCGSKYIYQCTFHISEYYNINE